MHFVAQNTRPSLTRAQTDSGGPHRVTPCRMTPSTSDFLSASSRTATIYHTPKPEVFVYVHINVYVYVQGAAWLAWCVCARVRVSWQGGPAYVHIQIKITRNYLSISSYFRWICSVKLGPGTHAWCFPLKGLWRVLVGFRCVFVGMRVVPVRGLQLCGTLAAITFTTVLRLDKKTTTPI